MFVKRNLFDSADGEKDQGLPRPEQRDPVSLQLKGNGDQAKGQHQRREKVDRIFLERFESIQRESEKEMYQGIGDGKQTTIAIFQNGETETEKNKRISRCGGLFKIENYASGRCVGNETESAS